MKTKNTHKESPVAVRGIPIGEPDVPDSMMSAEFQGYENKKENSMFNEKITHIVTNLARGAFAILCLTLTYSNIVALKDKNQFSQLERQAQKQTAAINSLVKDLESLKDPKIDALLNKPR